MSIEFQDVIGDNYYGGSRMRLPERRKCAFWCKSENSGETWCDCGAKEANLMHDLFTAYLKDRQLDREKLGDCILKFYETECLDDAMNIVKLTDYIIGEFNAGGLWK